MSFRFTHIHDYHRFVAIDLGRYRVRAGIYDVSEGGLFRTGFSSVRQSRKNFSEGVIADIGGIARSIEQTIIQAASNLDSIPEDVIVSFPSHTFISDLITTQYTRSDPESILTMQEIDTMIKRIEKTSHERARAKNKKQFGITGDDLRLVSSTIVSIQIDGRNVMSPIGFSGGSVRLTILNVFVPSSEFNIIRSVVSHIDKKIISIIPEPLILPKLIENINDVTGNVCLIDIGYGHSTITIMHKNEILGFEIFPYGTEMLMEQIAILDPNYSLLQIENIICSSEKFQNQKYQVCLDEFLSYIGDMIFGYLQSEYIHLKYQFIILHGNLFENNSILLDFHKVIHNTLGHQIQIRSIHEMLDPKIAHDQCMTYGLSLMARELLLVKKDPLVRILRYVLYQYE